MIQKEHIQYIERGFKQASLVLRPFDPIMVSGAISGKIDIKIRSEEEMRDSEIHYVKTPSGRFAFYNLTTRKYTFIIKSSYYLNKTFEITFPVPISSSNNKIVIDEDVSVTIEDNIIVINICLLPSPSYLFSAGSTLLRPFVTRNNGNESVADAKLFVVDKSSNTSDEKYVSRADSNGQAVICCNRMTKDSIMQMNGFDINFPKKVSVVAKDLKTGKAAEKEIEIREFWETPVPLSIQ